MDDDHDSGLDGGPGHNDNAGFADVSHETWLQFYRGRRGAEFPENSLSDENLARYTQILPRPSKLHLRTQINDPMVLRLRNLSSRSSQQQDTLQDGPAQGSEQNVLRLRGVRSRSSEPTVRRFRGVRSRSSQQQDTPQDDLAQGNDQMVLSLRGARSQSREQQDAPQDGLAQSSEQQAVASRDDLSQNSSATDTASDAGQD